jgi:YbbR domain-containing protein
MGMRMLALVIAVALWFVAASDTNTRTTSTLEERVVPATVKQEGVSISLVPVTRLGDVEVRLRVPGGTNIPDRLDAYVDLTGRRAGEHRVPVHVNVPPRFSLISISPDTVTVRLERSTMRTLPVELAVVGLPPGVTLITGTPDPPTTVISGAETRVNRVARVLATVTYDPSVVTYTAMLRPIDSAGLDVNELMLRPKQVKVDLELPENIALTEQSDNLQSAVQVPGAPVPQVVSPSQPVPVTPKPATVQKQIPPKATAATLMVPGSTNE